MSNDGFQTAEVKTSQTGPRYAVFDIPRFAYKKVSNGNQDVAILFLLPTAYRPLGSVWMTTRPSSGNSRRSLFSISSAIL